MNTDIHPAMREVHEIDGHGIIHFLQGELHFDKRENGIWPIAFNHDSNVISFRLDHCTPATLRAAALLLEQEEENDRTNRREPVS